MALLFNDRELKPVITSTTTSALARYLLLVLALLLFSGCAALPQQKVTVNPQQFTLDQSRQHEDINEMGWWHIGFHRTFDSEEEVQWQYDAFIALKVFRPVIENNKNIELWRFHRRAGADTSGHKFSFLFYATRQAAEKIYQHVNGDVFVQQLLNQDHISSLSFYDINSDLRSKIESTSDKKWPLKLQKSWPYFIMGVSRTWLDLVEQFYGELQLSDEAQLDEQLEGFKQVSADIDLLWTHNGSHAFFHHLNALFAYQELYVIESQLRRF